MTTATTIATIARLTLRRLRRGGALMWISAAIACLPIVFAILTRSKSGFVGFTFRIELLVLGVLAPLFVASSIGEEIEDRTMTYLWSRPIARWTVLVGKLVALMPLTVVLVVVSWIVAIKVGLHETPELRTVVALGAGAVALSTVSAGIATLVPKHGMAIAIVYGGLDFVIGQIPASLQIVSVTHQVSVLAGHSEPAAITAPAITMAAIASVWLAIGLARMRRLES